jgi:hypothetical protein
MTPEEKFNQDVLVVLELIKKKLLYAKKGSPISLSNASLPAYGEEILEKLEEWKIIKIRENPWELPASTENVFCLDIIQPKFDEIYYLYESGGFYLENQKTIPKAKISQSIIKPKSLELIAKEIGDLDSGSNLVEFLTNCGVKRELIEYPNTKWRMIYSVLITLASSRNKKDRRTLFKIIEGACHPLMYGGDKNLAKKTTDKLNSLLEYDNFFIKDGVLWEGWDDGVGLSWSDKDGNNLEDRPCYLIIPQQMDKLYVYWNELIKLTKFYFNNKDSQDDEINDIYFEIIANVEQLLNSNECGGLKEDYKKPFRNMIGCEFEIQKQGLNADGLFVNLYDFLGRITEFSLPDKNNVEKIKKDNSAFFTKIKQYSEQHLARKETIKEPPATKIKITGMPPLEFKEPKEKKSFRKVNLKSMQISYDDDKPEIKIGKQNVALPPYKNEHYFCQAVFEYKPKEPISWDVIFDKMTGHSTISGGKKPEPIRENWQKVNDTMKRINNRIKEVVNTDDDLFSWSEKMVIRNY